MARRCKTPWLKRGVRRKRSSKVGLCAPNTPYNSSSFLMRVQQKKETPIHGGVEELGVYEYGSMADFIHLPAFSELTSTSSCTSDPMLSLSFSASAPKPSATTDSANLGLFQSDNWVQSPDNDLVDQIKNGQSVQTSVASSCTGRISASCISQPNWRAHDHVLMKLHTKIVQALLQYRLNCTNCVNPAQLLQTDQFATPCTLHTDQYLDDAGKSLLSECLRLIQQELAHLQSKPATPGSDEDLNKEAGTPAIHTNS